MDIDTQFDFMRPDGKLYVPDALEITPNIKTLINFASENNITIISSIDTHTPDDPEFKTFPPHCIENSSGAEKIEDTLTDKKIVITADNQHLSKETLNGTQLIVQKHTIDIFADKNVKRLVRLFNVKNFIVFGVATEYCVRSAVMGLCHLGYTVHLVTDAIKPITNQTGSIAVDEMEKAGAQLIQTGQILRQMAN